MMDVLPSFMIPRINAENKCFEGDAGMVLQEPPQKLIWMMNSQTKGTQQPEGEGAAARAWRDKEGMRLPRLVERETPKSSEGRNERDRVVLHKSVK